MFNRLRGEGRALIKDVVSLTYFMRGAISYTEMMNMSFAERDLVHEFIDERLETEKKNPHPVY